MTTVLAALDSNSSAQPVLSTAIAVAELLDATVTGLHVRENAISGAPELARAAGVELREVSGSPVQQIVLAAQDPDVAALVLGARGLHGGPQPAGHTALDVITRVSKPVVVVPPHAQPPEQLARILLPLEGTSESSRALDAVLRLAHRRGWRSSCCTSTRRPPCPRSPTTSRTQRSYGSASSSHATSRHRTTE
jgi:nucleotide-binding universal stress UspA family protein